MGFSPVKPDVYADSGAPAEFAIVLRGFPKTQGECSFDVAYPGGGAAFRFYCLDSVGHSADEVRVRTDPNVEGGASDAATISYLS